jgi:hypothetical protein
MLTVTNAYNQRGWDANDHLLSDEAISNMIGKSYKNLSSLKRAAQRLSESYPSVEYNDGYTRYLYDGSPDVAGRHRAVVKELGPLDEW